MTVYLPVSIANAAHNLQFDFLGGTLVTQDTDVSTFEMRWFFASAAPATLSLASTDITDAMVDTSSAWNLFHVHGFVSVLRSGTLGLRAAQGSSGASNSIVSAGAWMRSERIS